MNWLSSRYRRMPARDRRLLWIFLGVSLISAYMFWAAMTWQQMFHVEKMANRKANRIETRLGDFKVPEAGASVSEKDLQKLRDQVQAYEQQLQQIGATMLPLHESGSREQLKLELTRLAEDNQLSVASFRTLGSVLRPPVESLSGQSLRDYFRDRPRFELEMSGRYFDLVAFVDGLRHLSFQSYVGNLRIERHDQYPQALRISLQLHI